MTERLLLDTESATQLMQHQKWVGEALNAHRAALTAPLGEAALLLTITAPPSIRRLLVVADHLLDASQRLAKRIWIVLAGGNDINAGLWALAALRDDFAAVETRGGESDADGYASSDDLRWAADNLAGSAGLATQWLLEHPEFLSAVAESEGNDDYFNDPYRADFVGSDATFLSGLMATDITSFETQLETWATLLPHMGDIDTAAEGGDADGTMSKKDFEAFLAQADLPADVRLAAEQILADDAYHDTGFGFIDFLDFVTFLPVVGDFVDAGLALYYFSQGDYVNAIAHGVGVLPIPGVSGGMVRGVREGSEFLLRRTTREGVEYVERRAFREAAQAYGAEASRELLFDKGGDLVGDAVADATDNPYMGSLVNVAVGTRGQVPPLREFEVELTGEFIGDTGDLYNQAQLNSQIEANDDRVDELEDLYDSVGESPYESADDED